MSDPNQVDPEIVRAVILDFWRQARDHRPWQLAPMPEIQELQILLTTLTNLITEFPRVGESLLLDLFLIGARVGWQSAQLTPSSTRIH